MNGDSSEETQAKKQQLQNDLKDAQADLEESQYQQWLTDQEKLMDSTFDSYSEFLSSRLDNIDGLLQDFIDYGNANSDKVNQTITDATSKVGYEISDGMKSIWNSTDSGIGQILTEYNGNFMSSMSTISEYLLYIFHKMGGMTKEETEAKRLKDEAERKKQEELRRQQEQAKQQQQAQQQAQKAQQQSKQPQIGSTINAGNATIYSNSYGGGGGRQYFASDPLYTIVGENNGYWLVRWHNLSSGYTGWFRKGDVTAMATGGYTGNNEGMAMLHAKERVLSATQTKAFETLVYDFLPKMSDELNRVGNIKANASAISGGKASNIENSIDLTVTLPNVTNGDDFVKALQTDKNVQKIIKSFTIDEAMGKNSLRKFNIK